MNHPSDETLAQMAHGGLQGAELEALEAHLDGCPACRSLMAAVTNGSAPYAPPERAVLVAGERLGRYEIESLIAAGGMGMVYAARDTQLNRRAVLKLMRPAFGGELGRVRLLREAQAMASLSHPNVVHVYELGESGERVFVAMELVEGGTLRDWMKSPGSWKDVVAMMVQAGRGLAAAHDAGVIHRDFKPENVLVGKDGRPRVGDFGLARPELVAEEELPKNASLRVTRTGTMLGTPAYMSPEQLAGKPADARSDQYSFCVTLYEALTGKRPFPADTLEELRARVGGGMPPPPKDGPIPAAVWAVIARGLHPDPAQRFPDMDALLMLFGAPVPEVAAPRARIRPRVMRAALIAAFVAAGGAGLVTGALHARPEAPATATPAALNPPLPSTVHLDLRQRLTFALSNATTRVEGDAISWNQFLVFDNGFGGQAKTGLTLTGTKPGQAKVRVWADDNRTLMTTVEVSSNAVALPPHLELLAEQRRALGISGVTRIAVGDAALVDAKVENDDVYVKGLKAGSTTLTVWTGDNRQDVKVDVTESIVVPSGTEKVLDIATFELIGVDNAAIANIKVIGSNQVLVFGAAVGETDLLIFNDGENDRHGYRIVVTGSVRHTIGAQRNIPPDPVSPEGGKR